MKKLIAILLIAIMALALVACGEGDGAPSTENQPNTEQAVSSSETDNSEEKTDASEGSNESVKTDETVNSDTENKEPTLDDIFKGYPEALHALGMFNSVENLDSLRIFNWTMGHVKPISENRDLDKQIFAYTYASKDLNNIAYKYLGHRWAFETVNGEGASGDAGYSYNQTDDTVTVTYYGAFGDIGPEIAYVGYTEKDSTHFTVNYTKTYPGDAPEAYFLEVELADGSYLVRSQKKAENDETVTTTPSTDSAENDTTDDTPSPEKVGQMLHEVSYLSQYLIMNYDKGPDLNAKQILTYFINNICSDLEVGLGDKVPAETVYEYVKKSFDFDEAMKTLLKSCELYDATDDTFTIWGEYYSNSTHTTAVAAYEDLGNNEYVIYIHYAAWDSWEMVFSDHSNWKATVTYRKDMEPKDFCFLWHSFEKIEQIPETASKTGLDSYMNE